MRIRPTLTRAAQVKPISRITRMTISFDDFMKVDLRLGKVVDVQDFPKARNPAYKVWVDFGDEIGIKKSSAQITHHYSKEDLLGRHVICVTNFAPRQIADFMSEVLITGFYDADGHVVLANVEDKTLPLGTRLA